MVQGVTLAKGQTNSTPLQNKSESGGQVRVSGRARKRRGEEDDSLTSTNNLSDDSKRKDGISLGEDDSSTSVNTKRVKIDSQKNEEEEEEEPQQEEEGEDDSPQFNSVDLTALIVEENDPILTGIQLIPHIQENIDDGVNGEILDCVKEGFLNDRQIVHPVTFPVSIAAANQVIHFEHPGTSSTEPYHKIEHNYPKLVLVDSADQIDQVKSGYAISPPHTSSTNLINLTAINPDMTVKFDSNVQYLIVEEQAVEQFGTGVQAIVINHQDEASALAYKFVEVAAPQKEKAPVQLTWSAVTADRGTHFELESEQAAVLQGQEEDEEEERKPEEILSDARDDDDDDDNYDPAEEKPKKKKRKSIKTRTSKERVDTSGTTTMFNVVNDGRLLCTLCGTGKTFKNKNTLYNHRSMYHRNSGNNNAGAS